MKNKNLKEKILLLSDLVSYKKSSIVSREIVNKNTGTITAFAFDKGEGLSEHTAPFDAIIYIISGNARISISGRPFNLKKGEMIIMPANKPHSLKALKKFQMLLIMLQS